MTENHCNSKKALDIRWNDEFDTLNRDDKNKNSKICTNPISVYIEFNRNQLERLFFKMLSQSYAKIRNYRIHAFIGFLDVSCKRKSLEHSQFRITLHKNNLPIVVYRLPL